MKAKQLLLGACVALAMPAAAQAGPLDGFLVGIFDTDSGFDLETSGIVFMNTLNEGYQDLSESRTSSIDFLDGEHFNGKARTAARRSMVPADEVTDRDLTPQDREALSLAFLRLRRAFLGGAKEVAPVETGFAQVAYDCWIEAAEGGRDDDAARCRSEFEERMSRIENLANYGLTPAGLRAAQPEIRQPYMVYFQFDTTVVTQGGQTALDDAIADALADPDLQIKMVGHADRSGAESYNQALSERRSRLVLDEMTRVGIDQSRITFSSVGETQPFVPTPDGVRNPGNRVVEINLM